MYGYPAKSPKNHKLGHCADGAPVKSNLEPITEPIIIGGLETPMDAIPWPQPDGVFTTSSKQTIFHPILFLQNISLMFQRLVEEANTFESLDLELQAVGIFAKCQLHYINGMHLFKVSPILNIDT